MLLCNVRVYVRLCSIAGYIACFVKPRQKSNWFLSISVSTCGSDPREAVLIFMTLLHLHRAATFSLADSTLLDTDHSPPSLSCSVCLFIMVGEKKLITFACSTTLDNASPGPVDISLAFNADLPCLYNLVEPKCTLLTTLTNTTLPLALCATLLPSPLSFALLTLPSRALTSRLPPLHCQTHFHTFQNFIAPATTQDKYGTCTSLMIEPTLKNEMVAECEGPNAFD